MEATCLKQILAEVSSEPFDLVLTTASGTQYVGTDYSILGRVVKISYPDGPVFIELDYIESAQLRRQP